MKRLAFFGAMNRDVIAAVDAQDLMDALGIDARPLVETPVSDALAEAGVARLAGQGAETILGGSAFNVARVVSLLDKSTQSLTLRALGLAGQVGAAYPHLEALAHWGVEAEGVVRCAEAPATCIALVEPGGRTLLTATGANAHIARIIEQEWTALVTALAASDVAHLTSYLDPDVPRLLAQLIAEARAINPALVLSLDPGTGWILPGGDGFWQLVGQAGILHLNNEEFAHLGGEQAVQRLLDAMVPGLALIVTRTHIAARVYERDATGATQVHVLDDIELPAPESIIDATGAGDTFCAGFLWGFLARSLAPRDAAALGFALARHKVGLKGPLSTDADIAPVLNRLGLAAPA